MHCLSEFHNFQQKSIQRNVDILKTISIAQYKILTDIMVARERDKTKAYDDRVTIETLDVWLRMTSLGETVN